MIKDVAAKFEAHYDVQPGDDKTFRLFGGKIIGHDTLKIWNEATIQHFYFGGNILFDSRADYLKPEGRQVVQKLGQVIRDHLPFFDEIQIQGHADTVNIDEFNLELAARRAMSVFWNFKNDCGINPHENLMSVTSFGEYKPVERNKKKQWSVFDTNKENNTNVGRDRNRRIEIILFYKTSTDTLK
ncbi:MAG TPA: OmpA family protein [Saprospiraceae bacterium]|nr:OmpA family protein [Saprospiraceae bacterium]